MTEQQVEAVARQRQRRPFTLIGAGLIVYGLIGVVIFLAVGLAISRPLDQILALTESLSEQRAALIDSLEQAETTIDGMAQGVRRMDSSLAEAQEATERASTIASGVSSSMLGLRDAVSVTILGAQPLIGLAAGFENAGNQLVLLSDDLLAIATALDANRSDVVLTADNLDLLADSVGDLTASIENGPALDISADSINALRFAIYAVVAWMGLLAIGCVVAGVYLMRLERGQSAG